jgi:hypothetical protein
MTKVYNWFTLICSEMIHCSFVNRSLRRNNMAFELVAYDRLRQSVKESIKTLIEHHNQERKGTIDINKLGESVKLLAANPEGRGVQAEFLLKAIELTETMDEGINRTRVLNAAVYHIHRIISDSYTVIASDSSTFNFALKTSLGLNIKEASRKPSDDDKYTMYKALVDFLKANVILEDHGHVVYKDKHPFQIDGYDVADDITVLTLKVSELDVMRLAVAKKERDERARPVAPSGLFGGWFSSGSGTKKPVDEATTTASHTP